MQMLNRTGHWEWEWLDLAWLGLAQLWNVSSGFEVWFDSPSREAMTMMMTTTIYRACSSVKLAAIKLTAGGGDNMMAGGWCGNNNNNDKS